MTGAPAPAPRGPAVSPYLAGNYAPVQAEITAAGAELKVAGAVPRDLAGIFVRTGSNPRFLPPLRSRYHWFDGDGMLHGVEFRDGEVVYRNRFVRTRAFLAEAEAGEALWSGATERPDFQNPRGPFKNSANTDVVYHAGQLLCLWWLSGEAYAVRVPELDTIGVHDFGGRVKSLTAHPKVDPLTGEMMFIDYRPVPPYLRYGVIDRDGRCAHLTTVDLAGPRLQHDIAITARHTILLDLSLMWDPELLRQGRTRARFFRDKPTRFGLVPRHGDGASVRWFDAAPCYMYHTINAWESGDVVTLLGCKIDAPLAQDPDNPPDAGLVPTIGFLRIAPRLCRWTFDLRTGAVTEQDLDDLPTEFPRMDNRVLGRRSRYSYNPRVARARTLLFDAVVKYDTDSGARWVHEYPAGCFGGEAVFAPRGNSAAEDDGYLVTFVANEATREAELHVLDARDLAAPPLCRVKIPQPVPTGYHACWIPAADLAAPRPQQAPPPPPA